MSALTDAGVKRKAQSAEVGVIYLVGRKLYIESTPVRKGEDYGEFKNHANGHPEYWQRLCEINRDLAQYEYEHFPRGRVVYDKLGRRFCLYLDADILSNKVLVDEISKRMHLPSKRTTVKRDAHYRCTKCLRTRENQ